MPPTKHQLNWFASRPKTSGVLLFLFLVLAIFIFGVIRFYNFKRIREDNMSQITAVLQKNVDQYLKNTETIAVSLALTVNEDGTVSDFDRTARQLYETNPYLRSIQLVPNGIIKYIHPLKGNEKAVGINLFKSKNPSTIIEAQKAVRIKKMFYQGPVKLTQGDIGVVGRLPIFKKEKFWGFAAVVINLNTFLEGFGISNSKYRNYYFQFSKINKVTQKEEFFMPQTVALKDREYQSIYIKEGDWKLYIIGITNQQIIMGNLVPIVFALLLAVFCAFLLAKLLAKQLRLSQEINAKASQLVTTESKYKTIFDEASVGIARVNSITGVFEETNPFLCKFLGYNEEELLQKKIKSVIHPDDVWQNSSLFKQILKGEIDSFSSTNRYINKSGDVLWGKISVKAMWLNDESPRNHILIVEDITSAKNNEIYLKEAQQRLEDIINSVDGVVYETELDTYYCTFMSNKVEELLGYPVSDWMEKPAFFLSIVHPDDQEWVFAYLESQITSQPHHDVELRLINKHGEVVWIKEVITVLFENGKAKKMRGIMMDITNKKNADEQLARSFELVNEQNQRLLNFSHIVSHNLRSHASNIEGISVLIETAPSKEDRDEMIQLLKKVAHNLNDTLYNLNNIVSIQTQVDLVVEPIFLTDFINHTLTTLNAQILNRQATIINKVDFGVQINYNKAYLESVLLNLISNALRYSHPDRKPVITLTCIEENGKTILKVSDNGMGIDMERYGDKIFGLYQTFNGNDDARGFGLFITKNQIEAMGGKIELQSALNQGSTFKIFFK